jgi:hypothetical protein
MVLVLFVHDGYSQIEKPIKKGNIILGGSMNAGGYNYNRYYNPINGSLQDNYKTTYVSLGNSISFGYFVCNGLVLGISRTYNLSYNMDSHSFNNAPYSDTESYYYGFGLSPYLKYYFRSGIFLGVETGFSYDIGLNMTSETRTNSFKYFVSPEFGYAIFITSKVSLEPGITYYHSFDSSKSPSRDFIGKRNQVFFSLGFTYFL